MDPIVATIKRFRGIEEASVLIDRIALVGGRTYQGKTSILQGVGAAVTGHVIPYLAPSESGGWRNRIRKEDAKVLLRDGASKGSAKVAYTSGPAAQVNWPGGTTHRDEGAPWASEFAAGMASLPDQDPKRIAEVLSPHVEAEPDAEVLAAFLRRSLTQKRATALVEELWPRITEQGWDAVLAEEKPVPGQLRGQWQEVTGETYGKKKAESWMPDLGDWAAKANKAPKKTRDELAKEAEAKENEAQQVDRQLGELVQEHRSLEGPANEADDRRKALEEARKDLNEAQQEATSAQQAEEGPEQDRQTLVEELEVSQQHLDNLEANRAPDEVHLAQLRDRAEGAEQARREYDANVAERDRLDEEIANLRKQAGAQSRPNLAQCAYCHKYNTVAVEDGVYFLSATDQPAEAGEDVDNEIAALQEQRTEVQRLIDEAGPALEDREAAAAELAEAKERTATQADIDAAKEKVTAARQALEEHDRQAREADRSRIQQAERRLSQAQAEVERLEKAVEESQQAQQRIQQLNQQLSELRDSTARDEATHLQTLVERLDAYLRAKEIHKQVQEAEAVVAALKPEGVRQEVLRQGLTSFARDHLAPLTEAAGWAPVTIDEDFTPRLGDRPYLLLSEAEGLMVRAVLHTALARLEGSAVVVVDGADKLKSRGISQLLKLAWAADLPFVIAASFNRPEQMVDLRPYGMGRSYWVADGQCQEVNQVLGTAEEAETA